MEEEKKEMVGPIPGFCHGAAVGGRFKVIKGLEMASEWEVKKKRKRGGFIFKLLLFWLLSGDTSGVNFLLRTFVSLNYI